MGGRKGGGQSKRAIRDNSGNVEIEASFGSPKERNEEEALDSQDRGESKLGEKEVCGGNHCRS